MHLSVRYETAADFVREYAENLSRGGLFIARARGLSRHRDVMVELELPGFGAYQVRAEVVHVDAAGAGLAIREAPDGFAEALAGYLDRLARRAEVLVLAAGPAVGLLEAAGYRVAEISSPGALAGGGADPRLVAVVVPGAEVDAYRRAARGELVVAMDQPRQLDDVLLQLDQRL